MSASTPRPEYPRPNFERADWINLNGEWEFEFDDERAGDREKWFEAGRSFSKKIQVPFCFQSKLSGINDPGFHDVVWYRRSFTCLGEYSNKRVILHFGAVDYQASVWINGKFVAFHEGGHTPFKADITETLTAGENSLVVKAEDFSKDVTLPRGKQYWLEKSAGIFYTRTTGIWQTVWVEVVNETYIDRSKLTPDIDRNEISLAAFIQGYDSTKNVSLKVDISFQGELVSENEFKIKQSEEKRSIYIHDFNDHHRGRWWTPDKPNLYDVKLTLMVDGQKADEVTSYFGMRKVSFDNGRFYLNNRPYYQRLVLDQGYFPDGILTAPSDEDLKKDVELTKAMGFNGVRKHQKVEDPRYLYWCDKLGLLVWGEMANAMDYSEEYVRRFTKEWQEAVLRDYNHPCVVAWVPINESWGVKNIFVDKQQQNHALSMYYLTKSLDATRPVISNDGWEHVKSDLCTIHDYSWKREILEQRYASAEEAVKVMSGGRHLYVGGYSYEGQPILVSEFGGIAYKKSEWEGWGYSGAENEEDFLTRLNAVVRPLLESPIVRGYCYTQLTDVEQEINGLLTYDRKPKAPLEKIKEIITGKVK